nr:iron ABC transporter permease [Veillonella denticariosi]
MHHYMRIMCITLVVCIAIFLASLVIGRFFIPIDQVANILFSKFLVLPITWDASMYNVVMEIRLPRVIGAIAVGIALAVSGAAYQGVFRNELVSPDLLGVSHGSSVGACVGILIHLSLYGIAILAFMGGIISVCLTLLLPRLIQNQSRIVLVLCGIIVSGFMAAIIGLLKYIADPDTELQDIVYWQLGSLSKVTWDNLFYVLPIIVVSTIAIVVLRWRLNILSLSDQEAQSLGVNVSRERLIIIGVSTLLTAAAVCLSGTIGWVGLVIPHLSRMLVGNDHKNLFPLQSW